MTDLLNALAIYGKFNRRIVAASIWCAFGSAMVLIAAIQAIVEFRLKLGTVEIVTVSAAVWLGWTGWHSYLFGRSRKRLLGARPHPYRRAFLSHIFPGISVGFSQMLRPFVNGANVADDAVFPKLPSSASSATALGLGCLVFVFAFVLFLSAWRTLGAARVGFVAEFVSAESFQPVRSGPYGVIRHPLFWSGILVSLALALISNRPAGYALAALNLAYGFAYNHLEDRRLVAIFGEKYAAYARKVPRIIPARLRLSSALSLSRTLG